MAVVLAVVAIVVALVAPWTDPALPIWAKLVTDAGILLIAAFAADMADL